LMASVLRYVLDEDDLQLEEKIGEGGTSLVFRGRYLDRAVAIKQMVGDPNHMSPKAQVNFDRELTILQRVRHPNLVEFLGIVAEQRRVSFVMEFCEGGTVFDLLHNSGLVLSWEQKRKCASDVGSAMQYLHCLNPPIVHRDLKSLNLLLRRPVLSDVDVPVAKVSDFGLSKVLNATEAQGCMTKNAGTFHWMAPEVFTSNFYDRKVDIYSYAMILYEILCQAIPFANVNGPRLGLMIIKGQRPDLSRVSADCPPYLRDLMVACWAKLPDDRPDFNCVVETLLQGGG